DATATATTDANGNYSFSNLYSGNYTIALIMPSGERSTTPNTLNLIAITSNQTTNFGLTTQNISKVGGKCNSNTTDIMIVIDHSRSMNKDDPTTGKRKIDEAMAASNNFIDIIAQNAPNARIGVVQMASSRD